MKIVILGGTGLIGRALEDKFSSDHKVKCRDRSAFSSLEELLSHLKGSDLVIQLSLHTPACRPCHLPEHPELMPLTCRDLLQSGFRIP